MSKRKIIIVGVSVTIGSLILALLCWYLVGSFTKPMIARGVQPSQTGWLYIASTLLAAGGLSLTSVIGMVATPIAAYFGVSSDTVTKVFVKSIDVGRIAFFKKLYDETVASDAKAKLRESAKAEFDVLFDSLFPPASP